MIRSKQPPKRFIRASEIGEYLFCAHSWWLHRAQRVPPGNTSALRRGRTAHARHGRAARQASTLQRVGYLLLAAALLMALLTLSFYLWGDRFG